MSARIQATRNVLTPAGLAVLQRKMREVHKLAAHYGFKEVSYLVEVAEMALLDAREALVPYRGDLLVEIERSAPDRLDA